MRTILLLTISNVFMTIAWYGHFKFRSEVLWKVIVVSWGDRLLRILSPGSREPHRLLPVQRRPTEDHSRDYYSLDLPRLLGRVSRRQIQMELPRGFCFYRDCSILYLSQVVG
jgi:hypothetical protein